MSGLCGWIGPLGDPRAPNAALERMTAALPGFAPNLAGAEARPEAALAVRSDTASAWSADNSGLWCAIDGEPHWPDPDLAATARDRGDGAALARAYRQWGAGLLYKLHGSFALAVIDQTARTALLAIDRTGTRSLAFARPDDGALAFASTLDALRAHPAVPAEVSTQALFDYLHLSIVPGPGTIYRDLWKLLPAQYLHWRDGRLESGFYWHMPFRAEGVDEPDVTALGAEMQGLLRGAVRRAIDGCPAERLGTFLSGGLDSSTVVGLAAEALPRPVKSFTIGFDADDFDESRYADIAARHFGAEHHSYAVTPADTAELVPRIAETYDEPFGNSSAVPTFHCARLAREHGVEVMLAGDGGDELFAGNARYVLQQQFDLYRRVPCGLRAALEPLVFGFPGGAHIPLLRKARGYIRRAKEPMPERMESYNFLNPDTYGEVFAPDFLAGIDRAGPMRALRRTYGRCGSPSLLQRMLHFDLQVTLADNDLRKVTRMCELAGVRVRFPFLADPVVAFAAKVPPDLLIRRLRLRHFYKEAMKDFLPAEIIAKRKQGFGLPFRVWAGQPGRLRDLVHDTLAAFRRRGIVRPAFLDGVLGHWDPEEARRYGAFVWYLVVLEHWLARRAH